MITFFKSVEKMLKRRMSVESFLGIDHYRLRREIKSAHKLEKSEKTNETVIRNVLINVLTTIQQIITLFYFLFLPPFLSFLPSSFLSFFLFFFFLFLFFSLKHIAHQIFDHFLFYFSRKEMTIYESIRFFKIQINQN